MISYKNLSNGIDIKKTQKKLFFLNNIIMSKTNNRLLLQLDYYKNYYSQLPLYFKESKYISKDNILILALQLDKKYISTITCEIYSTHITISSKTHEDYINRKYNLLLRTIIILLCSSIKILGVNIYKIKSYVINPISELTLIKHFNAKYCKNDKYILEITCDKYIMDNMFEKLNKIIDNLIII